MTTQIIHNFDPQNSDTALEQFMSALQTLSTEFALDLKILNYIGEDPDAAWDNIVNKGARALEYKNIVHFQALGGFLPKVIQEAQEAGQLWLWSAAYAAPWFEELKAAYAVDHLDQLQAGCIVMIKPNKFGGYDKKTRELMAIYAEMGVTFMTPSNLYAVRINEAVVTVEDCQTYLHNLKSKKISPNVWEIKAAGRETLTVEYLPQEDNWCLHNGTQKLEFRKYYAFNGNIATSQQHTALVVVLNYLLTVRNKEDFKGRKAYLSNVFTDEIHVGYSHKLLERFNKHKLGNLAVELGGNRLLPLVSASSDLASAATSYEEAGHSVFLHKGCKYLVIDGDCAFFTRLESQTFVAWQSDKRAKLTGRNLFSVATAGELVNDESNEIKLVENKVYSRALDGDTYSYSGIEYREAAVASPLVEEGSGQGLGHPETTRTLVTKTKVKCTLPLYAQDEDQVLSQLSVLPVGTDLEYGAGVIFRKSRIADEGKVAIGTWDSLIPGKVVSKPQVKMNYKTNTVEVAIDCIHVQEGDAEKFRGFCKFRSNGGFLRNIEINNSHGELIFNPNLPLNDEAGELAQCEHVIGGEEYKTLMFVISLLADKMPEGKAIWNSQTGDWENKAELEALIESEMQRVTVRRWDVEASCYQMLKAQYGEHPDFEFDDSNKAITHHNAMCWVGNHANIVEVPLTGVFVGKCKLFAEHIAYLGTEYPQLYRKLLSSIKRNQAMVEDALDIVKFAPQGATDENPYGDYLIIDDRTLTVLAEEVGIGLKTDEDGFKLVSSIKIAQNYSWEFLQTLAAKLKKAGRPGFVIEALEDEKDPYPIVVPLGLILGLTGTISHKVIRNLVEIFIHLETPLVDEQGNKLRKLNNWQGRFYRYVRLLEASLEESIVNSNALIAKATKTSDLAFTCRAGSTIDASVALDELHIHPDLLKFWGLRHGDTAIIGRVPVPGAGTLKIVSNHDVPYGTAVVNAATKHAIEEGDSDGDSMIFLALDSRGRLIKPSAKAPSVTVNFS